VGFALHFVRSFDGTSPSTTTSADFSLRRSVVVLSDVRRDLPR